MKIGSVKIGKQDDEDVTTLTATEASELSVLLAQASEDAGDDVKTVELEIKDKKIKVGVKKAKTTEDK